MSKDSFAGFHPVINMLYFVVVIGFAMFLMHPVCLTVSLFCAAAYSIYLSGKKAIRAGMLFMLPMLIFTALLNPLFNHQGGTILAYLPNGNPITLESIAFGIAAAVMLITVIAWFYCLNSVMTSDKFVYLFGRVIPALSLILSMSLRLVPRYNAQIKVIYDAQKCIGQNALNGNLLVKARLGIKILSILVTWALENAIETADSMKSRGYGLPGRTAFSIFSFQRRDIYALAYIFICFVTIIIGLLMGGYHFRYFPTIRGQWNGADTITIFAAYFALGILPLVINMKEDLIWKRIKSKI